MATENWRHFEPDQNIKYKGPHLVRFNSEGERKFLEDLLPKSGITLERTKRLNYGGLPSFWVKDVNEAEYFKLMTIFWLESDRVRREEYSGEGMGGTSINGFTQWDMPYF